MKKEKRYVYPYKYLTNIFELDINLDTMLTIIINVNNVENNINVYDEDRNILSYQDKGKTMLYLKGLGKFISLAEIVSNMKENSHFDISDKFDDTIGISKIHTLNNDYVIIGGYNHWSIMLNIDGLSRKNVINLVVESLISYLNQYGFLDLKTMYFRIPGEVAIYMDSHFLKKPYIYLLKDI